MPGDVPAQPLELTPQHLERLQRLLERGFKPAPLTFFSGCVAVQKYGFAALLRPGPEGGFTLVAPPGYLVAGQLSARVERGGEEWFVWKEHQVRVTPELRDALLRFTHELKAVLEG